MRRLHRFLVLTTLFALGVSTPAAAQVGIPAPPLPPAPVTINLAAGDDGWTTTNDGATVLRFDLNPLPADFFGLGSDRIATAISLAGNPLANTGGLAWNTDTIVRRMAPTGPLSTGSCATVPIEFVALHLESAPFTVTYGGVPTETWKIVGGLTVSAAQPIGSMKICRGCGHGGTFNAGLRALLLLRYVRTSPSPAEIVLDCGVGDCPEFLFRSSGSQWTQSGALGGLNIDPLPAGVRVDVDADGTPDGATTAGKTNFQGGIKICGTGGGGGGGGAPECARVDHVANDSGDKDHSRSSHSNYAAGGDSDGDGLPDHCACEDANGDGVDDDGGGHPCPHENEEPPNDTDIDH